MATMRQLGAAARVVHEIASNAIYNGDPETAAKLLRAEACLHRAAGALQLAVTMDQLADGLNDGDRKMVIRGMFGKPEPAFREP